MHVVQGEFDDVCMRHGEGRGTSYRQRDKEFPLFSIVHTRTSTTKNGTITPKKKNYPFTIL